MQGRIVSYNPSTRTGVLSDGNLRHQFAASEWLGASGPLISQTVEFNLIGSSAVAVRPIGARSRPGATGCDPLAGMMQSGVNAVRGAMNPFGQSNYGGGGVGFWHFYFSPNGRVSLGQYWRRYLLPFGFLTLIVLAAVGYCAWLGFNHRLQMIWVLVAVGVLVLKLTVLAWVSFVMHIKRYHDLNMSWGSAYIVDNFMPFGRDWMAYRVMCQQGTQGPNQFGADPREYG